MYKIYQVEYNDTLSSIASKTNSTIDTIKSINGFNSDSDLVVGSLIVVPKENESFEKYIVKQGDSIYSISRLYNVDPTTLLLLNGLNKSDYIYPNQEIVVPRSDITLYVTREGDTISSILNNLGIDINTLGLENTRLFVMPDQLIIHKKETNR